MRKATDDEKFQFMRRSNRLSGAVTERVVDYLDAALERKEGQCPSCEEELLYSESGNSYMVFCSNDTCPIGFTSRGI